jgi:ribosomal protein S12 methylthiotransferase
MKKISPSKVADEDLKNVHMISLGCARNLVDSEVMLGMMRDRGYAITPDPAEADVIVVNTCGFIMSAKQESVDTILEASEFKNPKKGKCKNLVVAGCMAERYPGEIKDSLPEVDLVLGTAGFNVIAEELSKIQGSGKGKQAVRVDFERIKDYDLPRVNTQPFYTAYLKLAEGCAKRCSFCIIPALRGPLRSRSVESLTKEAKDLVAGGVRELNLIAQDLTDYGRDRKDGASLEKLLESLITVSGLEWIRLFYVYPDQLSDGVIEMMKTEAKICNYLDVPVQHISDEVLKRMNRKTTGKQIEDMLLRLKNEVPGIVLRTSLMVGFPGETEEQFQELCRFVEKGYLDQVGVFTYSSEEGTNSAKLYADDIPQEEKERRQALLYSLQNEVVQSKLESWIGKTIEVLVEGNHPDTELLVKGRHYGQAPEIDNATFINKGHAEVGQFVKVRVTELAGMDLVGEII